MSEYLLFLVGGKDQETATLTTVTVDQLCHLTFRYRDRTLQAIAPDYFEAFCSVRLHLKPEGLVPFCYGASLNVFPSGMARDMSAGMCAYRLTAGKRAAQTDLVRIFDSGPDVVPASVADQKQFFATWRQSITDFSVESTT